MNYNNISQKLQEYLIPKSINLKNEIPLGIILAFTKEIIISPDLFDNLDDYNINRHQKFSVLIFYSFITGNVERYLMNHSKNLKDYSNLVSKNTNFEDNNTFIYQNNKYLIDNSKEHEKTPELTSFNYFTDGIISRRFYNVFIWELLRDFFFHFIKKGRVLSYTNPNMDIIRKITHPYIIGENINLGTGVIDSIEAEIINADTKYKIKDYTPLPFHKVNLKTFISPSNNPQIPYILYIPKIFENAFASRDLGLNINLRTLLKKDYPQSLLDFKKNLSFSTIENINDFSIRIKNFNYHITKILLNKNKKFKK